IDKGYANGFTCDQRDQGCPRTVGNATDVGAFEGVIAPATVTSVYLSDGSNPTLPQRSMIRQLIVVFSEPVTFLGDVTAAFTLHRAGMSGAAGDVALAAGPWSGTTSSVTIIFYGPLTESYSTLTYSKSLIDGVYNLTIGAAQITGTLGALDGNN